MEGVGDNAADLLRWNPARETPLAHHWRTAAFPAGKGSRSAESVQKSVQAKVWAAQCCGSAGTRLNVCLSAAFQKRPSARFIHSGEVIEDYPADTPYPSRLLLGRFEGKPLHVVAAYDQVNGICVVVTAYIPDDVHWSDDFKTRKGEKDG